MFHLRTLLNCKEEHLKNNLKKEKAVSLFKFQDSSQSLERPAGENYCSK